MTKTHIALVGGQIMPIYIGINEFNPDKIILIHSTESKKEADIISNEDKDCCLVEFNSVDYKSIYQKAQNLLNSLNDEVTINISSGTKPWAIAFSILSVNYPNVTIIYIDQNSIIYDYTHLHQWNSQTQLATDTILKYNNQIASSYLRINDYTNEDKKVLSRIKSMRKHNYKNFNALTIPNKEWAKELRHHPNPRKELPDGSSINYNKATNTVSLTLNNHKYGYRSDTFVCPHVNNLVFNAGWFEYEVALLFNQWKYTKDIWMNVIFPYQNNQAKNEIDIIVNIGNKLLFVECKTQITDNTDIDKFRTAVRNYGGMGCKALFITESVMKNEAKEKCEDSKILTFCMNSTGLIPMEKALFLLLENELFNINTK